MKVRELKELLNEVDGDYEVILSKDSEGNSFSPLDSNSLEEYIEDSSYSGHLGYTAQEVNKNANSIVLWPIN